MALEVSRRFVLRAATAGLAARGAPIEWAYAASWGRYKDALVIDGLGGPGSSSADSDAPLTDAHVQDARDSGLTCVHVTILPVGTISATVVDDRFKQQFAESIRARREAGIAAPGETETGYLFAADLNTPRRLETLASMLADRGHSSARIEKILGGNLLRVFRDTWG